MHTWFEHVASPRMESSRRCAHGRVSRGTLAVSDRDRCAPSGLTPINTKSVVLSSAQSPRRADMARQDSASSAVSATVATSLRRSTLPSPSAIRYVLAALSRAPHPTALALSTSTTGTTVDHGSGMESRSSRRRSDEEVDIELATFDAAIAQAWAA
jgi:hypothetical protein